MPRSLSGEIGQQAEKVKSFIENLRIKTAIPVEYRDERLSTVSAKHMMREAGSKKGKKKIEYDAAAAAIILQSYLDENRGYGYDNSPDNAG